MRTLLFSILLLAFGLAGCGSHSHTHAGDHAHNPDGSDVAAFVPTQNDKTNLIMAYLSYIGEQLVNPPHETKTILARINKVMARTPELWRPNRQSDWQVVWGPAIYTFPLAKYQDNGMFVARQISKPENYIVAIRGTNFLAVLDWVFEDFDVLITRAWGRGAGDPRISEATYAGVGILNDYLRPNSGLPGAGLTLKQFLTNAAANNKINVSFTGHSLGGALAPTLGLLFKQDQGVPGGWDYKRNATVTSTSFAGATAGNFDFARYSNQMFGTGMRRIHDTNDVVPHAWQTSTMKQIEDLYSHQGLKMELWMRIALHATIDATSLYGYTQINQSLPFIFPVDRSHGNTFTSQMSYQHTHSYPMHLLGNISGLNLIKLVNENKGP